MTLVGVRDLLERMAVFYLNKYDWTEVVYHPSAEVYYDGVASHDSILRCHEADALDYGEQNPYREVTAADVALMRDYSERVLEQLVSTERVHEAAEQYVCHLRYKLIRNEKHLDVTIKGCSDGEAKPLLDAIKKIHRFITTSTMMDEPELTWALRRAGKIARVLADVPSAAGSPEHERENGGCRAFVNLSAPMLMAVHATGQWFDGAQRVESIHRPSYREVSMRSAGWLLSLGDEFRLCWTEARHFYSALLELAHLPDGVYTELSDSDAQRLWDALVAAIEDEHEELLDYFELITSLRKIAVTNAATVRLARRAAGSAHLFAVP